MMDTDIIDTTISIDDLVGKTIIFDYDLQSKDDRFSCEVRAIVDNQIVVYRYKVKSINDWVYSVDEKESILDGIQNGDIRIV